MNQLVAVCSPGGEMLAQARIDMVTDDTLVLQPEAECRKNLFRYFFLQHGREVTLQCDDICLRGALRTKVEGTKRLWMIALRQMSSRAAAPIDPPAGHGHRAGVRRRGVRREVAATLHLKEDGTMRPSRPGSAKGDSGALAEESTQ